MKVGSYHHSFFTGKLLWNFPAVNCRGWSSCPWSSLQWLGNTWRRWCLRSLQQVDATLVQLEDVELFLVKEAVILLLLEPRTRVSKSTTVLETFISPWASNGTEFQIQDRKPRPCANEAGKHTAALSNQGRTSLNQVKGALFWEINPSFSPDRFSPKSKFLQPCNFAISCSLVTPEVSHDLSLIKGLHDKQHKRVSVRGEFEQA